MVQHTTAGFLQRLFLLLSGIAPTCFIGVTPLQLAVCVVSGADGTQATPESEYCTGTHSRPMRIHRETFAKTLEWETHVFCRGCWAGRWMPETADGHPCFSLREWSAEIEAKEKENTAEREREKVNDLMILFKALDPESSPNLSSFPPCTFPKFIFD